MLTASFFLHTFTRMLRVREKLYSIVLAMSKEVHFSYANVRQFNNDVNSKDMELKPVINVVELESGMFALNPNFGSFRERYPATQIQFLDISEFDYNSDQNDCIVDRMKEIAKEFLLRLDDSELFEPITDVPFNQVFRAYDDNLSGIEITLNLRELNSQNVCLPKRSC